MVGCVWGSGEGVGNCVIMMQWGRVSGEGGRGLNKNVGYHAWLTWKNCQLVLAKKNWVKKKY